MKLTYKIGKMLQGDCCSNQYKMSSIESHFDTSLSIQYMHILFAVEKNSLIKGRLDSIKFNKGKYLSSSINLSC